MPPGATAASPLGAAVAWHAPRFLSPLRVPFSSEITKGVKHYRSCQKLEDNSGASCLPRGMSPTRGHASLRGSRRLPPAQGPAHGLRALLKPLPGSPSAAGQRQTSLGGAAGPSHPRPAPSPGSALAPARPAPPSSAWMPAEGPPRPSHTSGTQSKGVAACSLRVFAPNAVGVTCPRVTLLLVQQHTDITASGRSHPSPVPSTAFPGTTDVPKAAPALEGPSPAAVCGVAPLPPELHVCNVPGTLYPEAASLALVSRSTGVTWQPGEAPRHRAVPQRLL